MVAEEKLLEIEIEPGMRDRQEYDFIAEGSYNATCCIALRVWFISKRMTHPHHDRISDVIPVVLFYSKQQISLQRFAYFCIICIPADNN